ncbi:MAG TPA: ATP-binding protein, partial [Verrucomicrobiae bacterium]|nr:ATP-binding protein [Verrucomicrobiae bacterium]
RAQPQTSALPIILLLARAGEETCVEALEDGADDCLIDPFGARELLARVHTHLRLGKARRALEGELRQTNLTRMQELSGKQIGEGGLQPLLQEIMNTAVAILAANKGMLQVVQNDTLRILANHGHESPFLEYFGRNQNVASISSQRTVVEDVEKSPIFLETPAIPVLRQAGVRSMQSTPLITRGGRLLGILTTHWSVPHAPGEHELWRLDLLVRQITDLMESAEAEEALRKSEQRLATTLSHLPIGVGIVDTAGSVIDANPAWNRLLRRDGPSIEVSDRWPFPPAANPVLRALRGEEVLPGIEFLRMGEDGIERWTRAGGVPIRDETGQITGALAMVQDIDEERWAEAQRAELLAKEAALKTEKALRGADAQLARVVRALSVGELATSIAHEINQPLAGVVTNAAAGLRWLRGEPPNVEEARESLALVARDGNRASAIIRRIRDSLRKGTQVTTWFDLNEMIQETVVLAHANLEKERCVIQIELSDDIQRVRGDRIQLQQVILNLLLNGAEAMAGVEGARELRVQTRRTDTGVVVAIRDRGPGINPENLTRLFDAFFTTKPDGIGIGLSISRTIVEAHGGRIWADVKDGPGLTVQFELPAESANASRD